MLKNGRFIKGFEKNSDDAGKEEEEEFFGDVNASRFMA